MEFLSTFLEMGGYSEFVWPAYALTALVLLALLLVSLRSLRARERQLAALEAARPRRRDARRDMASGSGGA